MRRLRNEVSLAVGAVIAALEAANVVLAGKPAWLTVAVAVLVAVAGALGIRQNVSPVSRGPAE